MIPLAGPSAWCFEQVFVFTTSGAVRSSASSAPIGDWFKDWGVPFLLASITPALEG